MTPPSHRIALSTCAVNKQQNKEPVADNPCIGRYLLNMGKLAVLKDNKKAYS
jgi:hypothetical protein